MPVMIKRVGPGRYQVETPNQVHAKNTTLANAERQRRLLEGIARGWQPRRREQGDE